MAIPAPQQFCVRWNSHLGSLGAAFPQLLAGGRFVDVTLACEGKQLQCHKLVLAACSGFFESLLGENPCQHPIIILKDVKFWELQALVDFMYKGEVNVTQEGLQDLLKCAEALQIRGLSGADSAFKNLAQAPSSTSNLKSEPPQIKPPLISAQDIPGIPSPVTGNTHTNHIVKTEDYMDKMNADSNSGSDDMLDDEMGLVIADDCAEEEVPNKSQSEDFAMANVSCEYNDMNPGDISISSDANSSIEQNMTDGLNNGEGNTPRRIRRSEALLKQAADCVSRGQTFQHVSDMFSIPISTIRFFMARKGILPRRKRGRSSGMTLGGSRSASPTEPPYHFAHYKLPEIRPKLI